MVVLDVVDAAEYNRHTRKEGVAVVQQKVERIVVGGNDDIKPDLGVGALVQVTQVR